MTSSRVSIVEVSARDGLQSDPTVLSVDQRVALIRRAADTGLTRIEAVSFVNPKRVPQMADADQVMAHLNTPGTLSQRAAVSLIGLVLNERGLQQAIDTGVDEINMVVVTSDTFAEKNQGQPTKGLIDQWHAIGTAARAAGLKTSVTLAASFGCPFEGEVPPERLYEVAASVLEVQPDELALADSIGAAVPSDVRERINGVQALISAQTTLRCHFHNTRNTGLANAVAAVEAGVFTLDSSLGGIGGCPFAPNATGNIPTEDLLYMLHRMGYQTGVDLAAAAAAVPWMEELLGHSAPGYLSKAGLFPKAK